MHDQSKHPRSGRPRSNRVREALGSGGVNPEGTSTLCGRCVLWGEETWKPALLSLNGGFCPLAAFQQESQLALATDFIINTWLNGGPRACQWPLKHGCHVRAPRTELLVKCMLRIIQKPFLSGTEWHNYSSCKRFILNNALLRPPFTKELIIFVKCQGE